jgi:hypothetical protein
MPILFQVQNEEDDYKPTTSECKAPAKPRRELQLVRAADRRNLAEKRLAVLGVEARTGQGVLTPEIKDNVCSFVGMGEIEARC